MAPDSGVQFLKEAHLTGKAHDVTSVLWGVVAALGIVAAVTVVCSRILHVNATTAGFAYLIVVLGVAAQGRLTEAITTSLAAAMSFNFFFFQPVGTFTIVDPHNWVAVLTFFVTALVASHLSNRAKRETAEAREHQQETERLYAFSRAILLMDTLKPVGPQVVRQIAQTFDCEATALYITAFGEIYRGGANGFPASDEQLRRAALEGTRQPGRSADIIIVPIALGGQPIASLGLYGLSCSDGALQALVNLVAIALERERAAEIASRAEATRHSQQFKSTLLDAIAHEFKTPLTSIKAASTAVLSARPPVGEPTRELVDIIDGEADRLTSLVTEAVRMAQIEAGEIPIAKTDVKLDSFLNDVAAPFTSRAEGHSIQIEAPADLPVVSIDPALVGLAIRQLIDNALKYSVAPSPILIRCTLREDTLEIHVADGGPGIGATDSERIFEKYYRRGASNGPVPGTGIGLYIAREIVRAHGGDLWLEDTLGAGAEFCLSLPFDRKASVKRDTR